MVDGEVYHATKVAHSAPSSDEIVPSSEAIDHSVTPQPRVHSSYVAMVNSNKGISLNFIPATIVNGVKCAKLTQEDPRNRLLVILCSLFGDGFLSPPDVLKGFIRRIWKSLSIDNVSLMRNGLFLVRFHDLANQQFIVKTGVFFFDSKPLLVKLWNPKLDLKNNTLTSLPIWVQFHELELKYWGSDSFGKLGSALGIPFKIDRCTLEKGCSNLPEFIDFINDQDVVVRVPVSYEWKPLKCIHWHMFGHLETDYRKKHQPNQVWKLVQHHAPLPSPVQPMAEEEDGFIPVSKHASAKSPRQRQSAASCSGGQQLTHNQLDILVQQALSKAD
ncbi:LOW QUALITY PROTEIN: hypothetical protein Cgig2_010120 [Carnegiea gigantea]|uniref:DUF4283 domain-containing protein n=1 Tax=Carnegiea gigantea TaxID=171969 RepID=A0A9Q1JQI6_9CARY|nr:LOW QUALITY PROTEIN: hypothetical protein Cgig2_010120 [Carnegiea gigantea]